MWYFIIYEHQYTSKTTGQTQDWYRHEKITQQHPVDFLQEQRTIYAENQHTRYHYRLLFWAEIPEDVALKHKEAAFE